MDQISARISGTSLKVGPGAMNRGIFIRITSGPGQGEKYRITHPTACVNGILRGSFYATVTDSVSRAFVCLSHLLTRDIDYNHL